MEKSLATFLRIKINHKDQIKIVSMKQSIVLFVIAIIVGILFTLIGNKAKIFYHKNDTNKIYVYEEENNINKRDLSYIRYG